LSLLVNDVFVSSLCAHSPWPSLPFLKVTWEAAYRAFTKAADCRQEQGSGESAEVLFYLGEASDKLGDRERALDAFSR